MKRFLLLIGIAAVLWIAGVLFIGPKDQEIENKKIFPIVRLVHDGKTFCSGTVVGPNTIITAAHCIVAETILGYGIRDEAIDIRSWNNVPLGVEGHAYYATTQMDQGLIKGDFRLFEYKPYISNVDKIYEIQVPGKHLIACGYPMHGNLHCSALRFTKREGFFMTVDGLLLPGMSGGPTMLEDGTMIGVNVAVEGDQSIISPIYNIDEEIEK